MEHALKTCGSTVTTRTTNTVGTSDRTVLHCNGRDVKSAENYGRSELSLRYPHKLNQTMKTCIDRIDKDHMSGNVQPKREQTTGSNGPAGWAKIFACCGNHMDESTFEHPPPVGETVTTEDESDSVSSTGSLDAILDQVQSPLSSTLEDAILLENAKRDTSVNDSLRSKKRWRGPLRARSFGDKAFESPPLAPRKSSPRAIASSDVEERWRSDLKLGKGAAGDKHPRPSPIRSSSATDRTDCRRTRSNSKSKSGEIGHALPPPSQSSTTEHYTSNASSQSPKALTLEEHRRVVTRSRSRSNSKLRSGEIPAPSQSSTIDNNTGVVTPLSPKISSTEDYTRVVTRMRSRSNSKSKSGEIGHALPPPSQSSTTDYYTSNTNRRRSRSGDLGYTLPPPSPSSKKMSLENISGLDMLVELQKEQAEIEKKLTEDDRREPPRAGRRKSIIRTKGIKNEKIKGRKSKFLVCDRSISGFPVDMDLALEKNTSQKIPEIKHYIYGPRCGSFENIMTDGNPYGTEVNNTYSTYRMDPELARKVMSRMSFSLPMYHSVPSNASTKGVKNVCSEPVATEFLVRGPTYLEDSQKVVSKEAVFSILGANNILRRKVETVGIPNGPDEFVKKLQTTCNQVGVQTPFLLIVKFIVPWGVFSSYYYRPNGTNGGPFAESESNQPSEKLWKAFIHGNEEFRNSKLKLIPNVVVGPWVLKKMVGPKPGMVGQKLPVTYSGSYDDGYLEINMDVSKGGKVANSICEACANKASFIAVDLAFLLQGDGVQELPEQLLTVVRLHHIQLKNGSFL